METRLSADTRGLRRSRLIVTMPNGCWFAMDHDEEDIAVPFQNPENCPQHQVSVYVPFVLHVLDLYTALGLAFEWFYKRDSQ